LRLFNIFI